MANPQATRRWALAAVVIVLLGLATVAGRSLLAGGQEQVSVAELVRRGDSLGLGAWASRQCRGPEEKGCYESFFEGLTRDGHVRIALGALAELARRNQDVEREGHVFTHVIGITAWTPGRDLAEAFRSCTGLFQSGCYHGVIQSYLTGEAGMDSAKVAGLCDRVEGDQENLWLRFQCVHGLGHGLEMIFNWDLPRALAGCDWLIDHWDRESCYGGAFMENAVVAMPAHATARLVSEGAGSGSAEDPGGHGAHGSHGPDPSRITFKLVDSTDLLYPCTVVEHRYRPSCYRLQGGTIVRLVDLDYGKATAACDQVPVDLRQHCYLSIGTYTAGLTVLDVEQSIRLCRHGDPEFQPWCFVGVAKNFIDVSGRPEDGLRFCQAVPEGANRRQCYVAVGEQLVVLHPGDPSARARECAAAPSGDVAECEFGARLRAAPEGPPLPAESPPR